MHNLWMQKALEEAEKSLSKNEVPVGAVIVFDGEIIGRGHNQPILKKILHHTLRLRQLGLLRKQSIIID